MAAAEEERKQSGCGLMGLYNGIFRRHPAPPRRSSSAGSLPGSPIAPNSTPKSRRGSDDADLFKSSGSLADPQPPQIKQQQLPVVSARTVDVRAQMPNYNQQCRAGSGGGRRQSELVRAPLQSNVSIGRGLFGELDSVIYDHQREKGSSTLVRASSGNVMFFGDLGNLRGGGRAAPAPKAQGNVNRASARDPQPALPQPEPPSTGSLCRALSRRLDPEELKEMGNEEYRKGNFAEAVALYDRAIVLDPERASYWSNKAAALTGLGRLLEAVGECREAVRIDASYRRAHHRLATLYLRLGEAEKALRHYKLSGNEASSKDIARSQSLQTYSNKCTEARRLKDWNTVLREAQSAILSGADSAPQLFAAQAEALLKLQRHQDADMLLIDAPTFDTDESIKFFGAVGNAYTLLVRAQIDMAAGRFDEAVSVALKAAHIDPNNKEAAAVLRRTRAVASARLKGNELFKAAKFAEASVAYTEGVDHDPNNSILLCNRAACWMKLQQWEKAIEDCNVALNVRPSYSKARLRRADCNAKIEKWEESLQDYEKLVQEMPGDEEVQKALSDVQNQLRKGGGEVVSKKTEHYANVAIITSNKQFMRMIESPGASVALFCDKSSDSTKMILLMEQLCKRYPSISFLKVDEEDNQYITESEEVDSVPTFRIYRNGSRVKDIVGFDHDRLESAIKSLTT